MPASPAYFSTSACCSFQAGDWNDADRALAQRLLLVGNHQPPVDADDAAEAAAGLAGADGRVEGEQRRLRIGIPQVALGAVQAGGVAPDGGFGLGRRAAPTPPAVHRRRPTRIGTVGSRRGGPLRQHMHVDPPAAAPQRRLDRLHRPHALGAEQAEAVGHHVEPLARAARRVDRALGLHPGVAARRQPLRDFLGAGRRRQLDRKRHRQPRVAGVAGARQQVGEDGFRRVVAHELGSLPVEQLRRPRPQQLQVVVQLGHRADRAARVAHRIGLVDGDRRRHAVDAIDRRPVHAVEELARVGAEGLDVAPLPFGIQRVEHQARLARAARAGDHRHLAGAQIEVEVLEVVLSGAADADASGHRVGPADGEGKDSMDAHPPALRIGRMARRCVRHPGRGLGGGAWTAWTHGEQGRTGGASAAGAGSGRLSVRRRRARAGAWRRAACARGAALPSNDSPCNGRPGRPTADTHSPQRFVTPAPNAKNYRAPAPPSIAGGIPPRLHRRCQDLPSASRPARRPPGKITAP